MKLYFVLLMKSHLQSYPCPLQINSFWILGLSQEDRDLRNAFTGILFPFSFHIHMAHILAFPKLIPFLSLHL